MAAILYRPQCVLTLVLECLGGLYKEPNHVYANYIDGTRAPAETMLVQNRVHTAWEIWGLIQSYSLFNKHVSHELLLCVHIHV